MLIGDQDHGVKEHFASKYNKIKREKGGKLSNLLFSKHGCDYKGYGLASRMPRLDLSLFAHEKLKDRIRPVIQHFCTVCQSPELDQQKNPLIMCEGGCSRAYHSQCHTTPIKPNNSMRWYCSSACMENRKRNKVGMYYYLPLNWNFGLIIHSL